MADDTPDDVRAVDRLYGVRPGRLVPDRDLRDVVTGEQPFRTGPVWVFDPATGQHNGAGFFPGGRHQRAAAAAVVLLAGKVWSTLPTPEQRPGMEAWEGAAAAWAMTGTAWEGKTEARDRLTRAIQRHALDLLRPVWPTSGELEDVMNALVELGTLTDDGVSRLSVMLADHLRGMGDTEGAELWLAADREAQAAETHPALADGWGGGALDLPSWTVIDAKHRTTRAHRGLARAAWRCEVYPNLARQAAMPPGMSDAQLSFMLSSRELRMGAPRDDDPTRVTILAPRGMHPDGLDRVDVSLKAVAGVGMDEQQAERAIRSMGSIHAWRLLDLFMAGLDRDLAERGPPDPHRRPVVYVPAGKALARELGMGGSSGKDGTRADDLVRDVSRLVWVPSRGDEWRIYMPERISGGGRGKRARWALTAGLASVQGWHRQAPRTPGYGLRRFVAWPDVLPDVEWISAAPHRADGVRLGMGIVLRMRRAAGRRNGRAWQDSPGIGLAKLRDLPAELSSPLDLDRALAAWTDDGWLAETDGRILPGPRNPRLRAALDGAALQAADKVRRK